MNGCLVGFGSEPDRCLPLVHIVPCLHVASSDEFVAVCCLYLVAGVAWKLVSLIPFHVPGLGAFFSQVDKGVSFRILMVPFSGLASEANYRK